MINNRQNGRRRGRGGGNGGGGNGQRQGGQGRGDSGNRIDSRARGNAAQLLEKYKNLASDAQRQGDRVNTEYYLQFADHYFRVLADQRGRFENQQQPRNQSRDDFDLDGDDDFGDEGEPIRVGEQQGDGDMVAAQQHGQRRDRERDDNRGNRWDGNRGDGRQDGNRQDARADRGERPERQERADRNERPRREERQEVAGQHRSDPPTQDESLNERAEAVLEADAPVAPRRRGRPRREAAPVEPQGEANGVDADRLPPSLGIAAPANDADTEEPKPRRRRTRAAAVEVPTAAE